MLRYIDEEKYYEMINQRSADYDVIIPRISPVELTPKDRQIAELCDFLQTYSILCVSSIGTVIMVFLFYRHKIATPLSQLQEASVSISRNDLDVSVTYSNRDELGQLCGAFERMRKQLVKNNKQLWGMVEQEKILRAAIAHDIRAPLAILKGYQEMLLEFIPQDIVDKGQILEMLQEGMLQMERMDVFLNMMRTLSKLEDRTIERSEINVNDLAVKFKSSASILILTNNTKLAYEILLQSEPDNIWVDAGIVTEVFENLFTNAIRYAKHKVIVRLNVTDGQFRISVQDDGAGFTEPAAKLTSAYYHSNAQDDLNHFGLGLYLCRIYCEKHGGKLLLGNRQGGGADVIAVFEAIAEI